MSQNIDEVYLVIILFSLYCVHVHACLPIISPRQVLQDPNQTPSLLTSQAHVCHSNFCHCHCRTAANHPHRAPPHRAHARARAVSASPHSRVGYRERRASAQGQECCKVGRARERRALRRNNCEPGYGIHAGAGAGRVPQQPSMLSFALL
ncbi:hypothetical protein EDB92DRAFT_1831799 [Lactarius akahatsu]|uniref:Uncharacterized protein n=1 Tax=Lactarius akahatsu TaxID=416441 RepID=A0AAD4LSF6_9AGAM|nr:hypothetical protein EDB92DRAFT_1831799 [Lactarius akahatsu]